MMDIDVNKYEVCNYCAKASNCTEKDKFEKVAKEINELAKNYEDTFVKIDTVFEFKCKSYRSKGNGYDGNKETDKVF